MLWSPTGLVAMHSDTRRREWPAVESSLRVHVRVTVAATVGRCALTSASISAPAPAHQLDQFTLGVHLWELWSRAQRATRAGVEAPRIAGVARVPARIDARANLQQPPGNDMRSYTHRGPPVAQSPHPHEATHLASAHPGGGANPQACTSPPSPLAVACQCRGNQRHANARRSLGAGGCGHLGSLRVTCCNGVLRVGFFRRWPREDRVYGRSSGAWGCYVTGCQYQ